jgi:outer membrane protein assembly factor BamB
VNNDCVNTIEGARMKTLHVAAILIGTLLSGAARAWISAPAERLGYGDSIGRFANGDLVTTERYMDVYPDPADLGIVRLAGGTGEVLWRHVVSTPGSDATPKAAVDRDGTVIKLDGADGSELWNVPVAGPQSVSAFGVDAFGNVVTGGTVSYDVCTFAKLSGSDGHVIWSIVRSGRAVRDIVVDPSGDVLAASMAGGVFYYTLVSRISGTDGHLIWDIELPHAEPVLEQPTAAALDGSGRLVVAGNATVYNGSPELTIQPDSDINWWTVASVDAATGQLLWRTELHGKNRGNPWNSVLGLAVASDGTVYPCGSFGTASGASIYGLAVAAVDGATGAERWRYLLGNGGGSLRSSLCNGVAVSPDGSIVAAGRISGKRDNLSNMLITSLRPLDGHAIWEKTITLAPTAGGEGLALTIDEFGRIGVAGYLQQISVGNVPAVVKLNANGTSFSAASIGMRAQAPIREPH